jgi:hypothetical protein
MHQPLQKRITPILFEYRHEPKFQSQLMVRGVYDWCSPMKVISMFDNTKESLSDFLEEIHTGKIQLPDLQRSYTWCNDQIVKLIASISLSFPIGAILTIQVKNNSTTFKPRLVEGVQLDQPCLPESLILDGQQRSTTAYMCLRSGRSVMIRDRKTHKIQERYYYIDIPAALNPEIDRVEAIISLPLSQIQKTRDRYIDCSSPHQEFEQLLFPVSNIFTFAHWREGFQKHWNYEPEKLHLIKKFELEVVKKFEHYQLPIIQLRPELPKIAVCQIFEDMHEMPTPMTFFDLMTACFAAEDFSLRQHYADVTKHLTKFTVLQNLRNTDWLSAVTLVATYHRRQSASPESTAQLPSVGCRRQDILTLTLEEYKTYANITMNGFEQSAKFLGSLGFLNPDDIPYPMQHTCLSAILAVIGLPNDSTRSQLERWWWSCLFGEVYANWQNTISARDMIEVPRWLAGGLPPSTLDHFQFDANRLQSVTRRQGAIYKSLNALLRKHGAIDFLSGETLRDVQSFEGSIESHHIFPEAWCKQQSIQRSRFNCVINRTPLRQDTNRFVGGKSPAEYLQKLTTQQNISQKRLNTILESHLIDPILLRNNDFANFFDRRSSALAQLIQNTLRSS